MFEVSIRGLTTKSFYGTEEEMKKRTDKPIRPAECKFVRHKYKTDKNDDMHLAVLTYEYPDGKKYKVLKQIINYKRRFWITKKVYQKYHDKKEFEKIERLQVHVSTQSDLDINVCKALEKQPSRYNLSTLKDSPYLYGYEIPSTAFITHVYKVRNDFFLSDYMVVNLDIEFDVTGKYNDVSILTISMPGARHTAVLRRLYKDKFNSDVEIVKAIKLKSEKELPETHTKKNCKYYNVSVHDNDLDLLTFVFELLHKIRPDFVTIHNLVYDISRILERLDYYKINPEDVMCDPEIPKEYRMVKFKEAKQFKFKKGKKTSIPMEEQWSTVDIMASFMIMDTMTGYAFVRQAAGKVVGGYGLDNLLKSNGLEQKLFFEDEYTKTCSKKDYHAYMSENYPLEYTIYGEQDTVAMTEMESKTQDFTQSIPIFAGISDFLRFNSSTHKAICNAYLENIHKGLVVGTTPVNPKDWSILGTRNWIKTLPSDHIQEIGLEITNVPGLKTNVTAHADDVDCVSSYPSDIMACNVSLDTLRAEVVSVGKHDVSTFKDYNINLISSNANNTDYCVKMMNFPTQIEMLDKVKDITM